MSYVSLSPRPRYASFSGILDDVQINPDGTINIPSFGLSKVDLTDPKQLLRAQDSVAAIVNALPIDLTSITGGAADAGGAWQAQAVAVVQAVASGNVKGVVQAGVAAALSAGGTAACVATGVGAAVAPLCGAVAGMLAPVVMKAGEAVVEGIGVMFGMKSSAEKERDKLIAQAAGQYDGFIAAKESALVNLAKLEQALTDQTKYAAASAFAKVRGITPKTTADQILAKMVRDSGGALNPDAPMDPSTGFSARILAAQQAGKALYDQVIKDKAGAEFFLRAFGTLGPVIAKRYQYPGPVPRDGGAPNQVDFVAWWSNMPSDVWRTASMSRDFPLDANPTKTDAQGKALPCRMRSFADDDPANGWAGATTGKAYNYALPQGAPLRFVRGGTALTEVSFANLPTDADGLSEAIRRWNVAQWNSPGMQPYWGNFYDPNFVSARVSEMWNKRVECQISAHASAYRSSLQFQLGEMMKTLMVDDMRLRLQTVRDEQGKRQRALAAKQSAAKQAAETADEVKSLLAARATESAAPVAGGSNTALWLVGATVLAGGTALLLKSRKKK